jgi:hypothetical protein
MSRVDRLGALCLDEVAAAQRSVLEISEVACLYREWRVAGRELERLARALTRRHLYEGLRALERACVSLRITDELAELIDREHAGELAAADGLRRELLAEIRPWLAAARRELPAAAALLCTLVVDTASGDAAAPALRLLDELLDRAPALGPPKRRAGS